MRFIFCCFILFFLSIPSYSAELISNKSTLNSKKTAFTIQLEPYLGYQSFGSLTEKAINASFTSSMGQYYGSFIGGRWTLEVNRLFFPGLDLTYAPSLGFSSALGKTSTTNSTTAFRVGLVLGVNLYQLYKNIPLRFWIGYHPFDSINDKNNSVNTLSSGQSETQLTGTSFKLGAGYSLTTHININIEYLRSSFSQIKSNTLSGEQSKSYSLPSTEYFGVEHVSNQTLMFSISSPFQFAL